MHVAVLHDPVPPDAPPEARDTLDQARAVARALAQRGHTAATRATTGTPDDLARALDAAGARRGPGAAVVFNLVESPEGRDDRAARVPAWLRRRRVPFTGSGAVALDATNDKPRAKRRLARHGLPTPPWFDPARGAVGAPFAPGRYIVKPAGEHASFGMDDASVAFFADAGALAGRGRARAAAPRPRPFAERYVDGREFNVGLLEGGDGEARTLPPAEIVFADFPADKPRIVGYDAKWREGSFEYRHTVRRMDFPASDAALLAALAAAARATWAAFRLRGYARVDFRVDAGGAPWVLEVNANPCLTPGAGFAAMLDHAGLDYAAAIEGLARAALRD